MAYVVEQIEGRLRASHSFDKKNAESGLAHPGAAQAALAALAALFGSQEVAELKAAIGTPMMRAEEQLHKLLTSGVAVVLRAFYDRSTKFKTEAICMAAAAGHNIGGSYLQFVLARDENLAEFERLKGTLCTMSAYNTQRLLAARFDEVNWLEICVSVCRLSMPNADRFVFPATIGAMPSVTETFFPTVKRLLYAVGLHATLFDTFESDILALMRHLLPGEQLGSIIDEAFQSFMREISTLMQAFFGEELHVARRPDSLPAGAHCRQLISTAITAGTERLRLEHSDPLAARGLFAAPTASPTASTVAHAATPAAAASHPGNGRINQKRPRAPTSPAAQGPRTTQAAQAAAAPTAAASQGAAAQAAPATAAVKASTTADAGKCAHLVKLSKDGALLKIGSADVYDIDLIEETLRRQASAFRFDRTSEAKLVAGWLARGDEFARGRFVPRGCDPRFITYPFPGFNAEGFKTTKVFQ